MRHTPYGYKIENGKAVIDIDAAEKIRILYKAYLNGASLNASADIAGITVSHCGAKRIMENRHYLGDSYYPQIIERETFDKAQSEMLQRAVTLGRVKPKNERKTKLVPTHFVFKKPKQNYDNPTLQAQYLYSLIERTVV